MCGISGLVAHEKEPVSAELLHRTIHTVEHRGPDDHGVYVTGTVGLGSVRRSILDLSAAGHQPMTNDDESLWLVYNGELYNFQGLRRELE